MSLDKPRISKRKIKNVKARRDIKRKRARKMENNKKVPVTKLGYIAEFHRLVKNIRFLGNNRQEYIDCHKQLVLRTTNRIKVSPRGEWGSAKRIYEYSHASRQVFLHRALFLYEGAFQSLANRNAYLMTLSIRALYETTAAIGFLHSRINSYKNKNISAEDLDKTIMALFVGTKDQQILNLSGYEPIEAKHVMTMLEHADKVVSHDILGGARNNHIILTDIYSWLCEFCHPNFHSSTISYKLDEENEEFVFKYHKANLAEKDANIIKNISIATLVFIDIFDRIEELVEGIHVQQT